MADSTRHDKHYDEVKKNSGFEPVEVIESIASNENLNGQVKSCFMQMVKYMLRAGHKDGEGLSKEVDKVYNYAYRAKYGKWPWDKEVKF